MAMIVPPSPENRVENGNDGLLGKRLRLFEEVPGLAQDTLNVLPCGSYKQFLPVLPVFPNILPEKIEAFRDMHDAGLFLGKLQTPSPHEILDDGKDALLQKLLRDSCHDAIVGIAYQVDLVLDSKVPFELFLQSIKGHIGEARGIKNPRL